MPNKYLPALLAALIFCGCTAANQPNKNTCSQKLHKAENRDDLIKQMYQTGFLDECLYQYTPEQLTAIWQIPVVPYQDNSNDEGDDAPFGLYVVRRPSNTEDNHPTTFYIRMNQTMMNQVGSIFPEGHFPDVLPKPDYVESYEFDITSSSPHIEATAYRRKPDDQIQHGTEYYWAHGYRVIRTGIQPRGAVISLTFYQDGRKTYVPYALRTKYGSDQQPSGEQ